MSLLLEKEMNGQTRFKCQPDKMHNSLMKANQVVSDRRIVSYSGDPPGQYSVYIRPGTIIDIFKNCQFYECFCDMFF